MNVTGGDTNVSVYFQMRLTAGGDGTGLTIADFDLSYTRSGDTTAAKVDATALGAANTAHTDNYGIEVDATDCPGLYRFDFPDAAFAAGVRAVYCTVKHASCFTETVRVEIDAEVSVTEWNGVKLATTNPLPNAAADAAGGLVVSDAGGFDIDNRAPLAASITNMDVVYNTDFATNYNATRNAWVTNAQDFVGTTASDPFNGQVVAASLTGHTAQTGDTFALANGANGFANIKTDTAAILVDTGTTLDNHLTDIKGTGFVKDTHSLVDIEAYVDLIDDGTSGLAKIATDAAAILADTGTDGVVVAAGSKTGYALSATGLDLVIPADPTGVPTLGTSHIATDIGFIVAALLGQRTFNTTSKVETLFNQAGASLATGTWAYSSPTTTRPELT